MSVSSQVHTFYKDVVKHQRVWVLGMNDQPITVSKEDGTRVMPAWSSESRIRKVIDSVPGYGNCTILSCSLDYFLNETAPFLAQQNILVGLNWSGQNASGVEFPASIVAEQVASVNEK